MSSVQDHLQDIQRAQWPEFRKMKGVELEHGFEDLFSALPVQCYFVQFPRVHDFEQLRDLFRIGVTDSVTVWGDLPDEGPVEEVEHRHFRTVGIAHQ